MSDPLPLPWRRSSDRLTWAIVAAMVLHALVVLGVGFIPEDAKRSPNVLEVTLAHFRSDQAPRDADFVAQANQIGSGTEAEKRLLTTTERAPIEDDTIRETLQEEEAARAPATATRHNLIVTHSNKARKTSKSQRQREARDARKAEDDAAERRRREIASLEAQLAREKEAYAKRPKVR